MSSYFSKKLQELTEKNDEVYLDLFIIMDEIDIKERNPVIVNWFKNKKEIVSYLKLEKCWYNYRFILEIKDDDIFFSRSTNTLEWSNAKEETEESFFDSFLSMLYSAYHKYNMEKNNV